MGGAVHFIVGGIAALVLGFLLLDLLPDQHWRAFAAFPLGLIFIWLGVKRLRSLDE